eukprot:1208478-Rhodomonas_salina.3
MGSDSSGSEEELESGNGMCVREEVQSGSAVHAKQAEKGRRSEQDGGSQGKEKRDSGEKELGTLRVLHLHPSHHDTGLALLDAQRRGQHGQQQQQQQQPAARSFTLALPPPAPLPSCSKQRPPQLSHVAAALGVGSSSSLAGPAPHDAARVEANPMLLTRQGPNNAASAPIPKLNPSPKGGPRVPTARVSGWSTSHGLGVSKRGMSPRMIRTTRSPRAIEMTFAKPIMTFEVSPVFSLSVCHAI